ncbi:MAG: 1-acyl-sn-glycerol-3-phosphate acyltransferase [Simkaniaceae bacterium]
MEKNWNYKPGELDFLTLQYRENLKAFTSSFYEAAKDKKAAKSILEDFVSYVKIQIEKPFEFPPHHFKITKPIDYFAFGNNFIRTLVDLKHSSVKGIKYFDEIERKLKQKENVIFFANHQIEADPQAISILLENSHPILSQELTFVAGERVLTDPLAVPFSLGRNLLCIYSKKYMDSPPEDKLRKQLHNKKTMELMSQALTEGGLSIYVAPSGGRDRPNIDGVVEVAPFDPQSIEMFYLMAKRAKRPTHFYPLALSTYAILPPPDTLQIELGERRQTKSHAIHICCGPKIDMEALGNGDGSDRQSKRKKRALSIWNQVNQDYLSITRGP